MDDRNWLAPRGPVAHDAGPRDRLADVIGRDREIHSLRTALARLMAGQGAVVWLTGEPGIGKSTLAGTIVAAASALGCEVYTCQAEEGAAWFPLRFIVEALRVRPGADDPDRAAIARLLWKPDGRSGPTPADVVSAVRDHLLTLVERTCAARPTVLVLEDLHWADEPSLDALWHIQEATRQFPLLLVQSCRPAPESAALTRLAAGASAEQDLRIALGPLAADAVTQVVERFVPARPGPRLLGYVARAGGNPLFIRELVEAVQREGLVTTHAQHADLIGSAEHLPVSLTTAIEDRFSFLTEETTVMLRMAAVLGVAFSRPDLAALSGRAEVELRPHLDEAGQAGILAPSDGRVRFRHAVLRQALYEAIPAPLRFALHRQAAQTLHGAGAGVDLVAEHVLAAGDTADRWVIDWVAGSAGQLVHWAPALAVDLLDRVRGAGDRAQQDQFECYLAVALAQLGQADRAIEVAGRLAPNATDPEVIGRAYWILVYTVLRAKGPQQALALVEPAIEQQRSVLWLARLRALHSVLLAVDGQFRRAADLATEAMADGRRVCDSFAIGYAHHARYVADDGLALSDDAASGAVENQVLHLDVEARTLADGLAELGDDPDTADLRLLMLSNHGYLLNLLARPDESDRAHAELLGLAERVATTPRLANLRRRVAVHLYSRGRWDEAITELEAAGVDTDERENLHALGTRALIALHRNDLATLRPLLLQAADRTLRPGTEHTYGERFIMAQVLDDERAGHVDRAFSRLLSWLDSATLPAPYLPWLTVLVRLAVTAGRREQAAQVVQKRAAMAGRVPSALGAIQHSRGFLDADAVAVLAAAGAYHNAGYPLPQAQALEDAAVLLAERGELAQAREAHQHSYDIYASLDAIWEITRADARLRAVGVRRGQPGARRRPAAGWPALTPTELRIVDHIVGGASTPDIAARQLMSRSTVRTHITHIMTKLDVNSRVQIAREALRWRPPSETDEFGAAMPERGR